jgi:hypothetical protein
MAGLLYVYGTDTVIPAAGRRPALSFIRFATIPWIPPTALSLFEVFTL